MLLTITNPIPLVVGNLTISDLVEVTKSRSFIAGFPSTTLYAKGQSTIRNSVNVVAYRPASPIVKGRLIHPTGTIASPTNP